ncbi:MAG: hypothetical protein PHO63_01205 [Bacilli bacterium]|nr:hypothetical protein [Bacilli bacterium]MDD4808442.1 hypothetical protein [Bacilli bacterium]
MAFVGRYSLIIEQNNKKQLVPIEIFNNKKVKIGEGLKADLSSVDLYTTKFNTPQEMINDLKGRNIIVNGYNSMYISYRYHKQTQKLEVAFSEHQQLREIAKRADYNIDVNNKEFNKFLVKFLKTLDNNSFYPYLKSKKQNDMYILDDKAKLNEYLDERLKNGKYDDFVLSKIKEHMSSYKKFRDMYLALHQYNEQVEEIFYLTDYYDFYPYLNNLKNISVQTMEYLTEYNFTNSILAKYKIKEHMSYTEFLIINNLVEKFKFELEEAKRERLKGLEDLKEELLIQKELKEKYPEAYVDHQMNPYSSYEEEVKYQEYLDGLDKDQTLNLEKPKLKILKPNKKNKHDPNQLTIWDLKKKQ